MRWMIAAAALVAALCFDLRPSQAQVGNAPWCAVINLGTGSVYWDCQYRTIEDCVPNVIAGNRGFCNHNPRWEGMAEPRVKRPVRHHRRYTRRD